MTNQSPLPKDLFLLDPDVAFLNHGSFGATPKPVFEKYQWWQRELERQPVLFLGRRLRELMQEAREALAGYVGADADEVVYVPNATTGCNIVARSLALKPGDEILTTDHEYGALDRAWRFLCKKTGAAYTHVPIPLPVTTHAEFVERFWAAVTPRTKVIFLSHITSPTALTFPARDLCHRARAAGILTLVDGAHVPGQRPLDLHDLGVDFYSGNAHKWLCAPKGAAFLYARRAMQHLVEPLVVSWGYEARDPSGSRFVDEQEWNGTKDPAAFLSVPEAIRFVQTHDWATVRAQCRALALEARARVGALTGLPPMCSDSDEWTMQMVAMPLPPCDSVALKAKLYDEFGVEVPIFVWEKQPFVRVSIQAYNSLEDVERLLNGLARLLDA